MTMGQPGQPMPGLGEAMEKFLGIPAPGVMLAELQRLNNNMEIMAPDLHKLANALEKLQSDDMRNLSAALNSIKAGDFLRTLNGFTSLMQQIYEHLWGKS